MAVIRISWPVDDIAYTMTLFDEQKVYSSTSEDGPWTEVTDAGTRVALVAGVSEYSFTDVSGLSTYYYSVAFFNSSTLLESEKSIPRFGDLAIRYLTKEDLYTVVGQDRVDQLFDEDISGDIGTAESVALNSTLERAEAHVDAFMMLAYSNDAITDLANADAAFKFHACWIALEFAAERRNDFCADDGSGPYKMQFERAESYFRKLSRGRKRSKGESAAGVGANVGGSLKPTMPSGTSRFTFAPDDNNPTGHGGF